MTTRCATTQNRSRLTSKVICQHQQHTTFQHTTYTPPACRSISRRVRGHSAFRKHRKQVRPTKRPEPMIPVRFILSATQTTIETRKPIFKGTWPSLSSGMQPLRRNLAILRQAFASTHCHTRFSVSIPFREHCNRECSISATRQLEII